MILFIFPNGRALVATSLNDGSTTNSDVKVAETKYGNTERK